MRSKFSLEEYLRKKELARERAKEWRKKNPKRVKELRAKWYAEHPEEKKTYRRQKWKRWYKNETNAEKHRAWALKYYYANRKKVRAQRAAFYAANKQKVAAANSAWKKANPELVKCLHKKWRDANPEKVKAAVNRRRSNKAKAKGACTAEQLQARIDFYGGRCAYCGAKATVADHVKPLARGGTNFPANIRPSCTHCNSSKRDKLLGKEWPLPTRKVDSPR